MFPRKLTNGLPLKAKLHDEITASTVNQALKSDSNAFFEVTYHKKPWLLGFFGEKDGTSDAKYYGFKGEVSAFAGECYILFTNGRSPKYRAVYHRRRALVFGTYSTHYHLFEDYESECFITQKIENPLTLDKVFVFLRYLENDGVPFSKPFIWLYCSEAERNGYFAKSITQIDDWYGRAIQYTHENLDSCKGVMEENSFLALKTKYVDFLTKTKEGLLLILAKYEQRFSQEGNLPTDEISQNLSLFYNAALEEFCQKQLAPIKLEVIKNYEYCLMKNGLPEIMAVGYALGEWSFKARDILVDTKDYKILKIDHERCLWEITHTFLMDLGFYHPKNKAATTNQQSISSKDIDDFPKRTNPPRFWPSSEDEHYYPDWFYKLLDEEEFKKRAYTTWLAIVVTPDQTIRSLGRLFFKPSYSEKIIEHILKRKNNLMKAIKHSKQFAEFMMDIPETEIELLIKAHNKRWHKHESVCISFDHIKKNLSDLQADLLRKKDKIDSSINHLYTIETPRLF